MYAATQQNAIRQNQQQQQHHHQQPQKQQSLAASATQPASTSSSSAQEEALKRNTDCVYFLASPLTCKKGSDCEYRHSDFARVNPRDCWFWLNGNCLNPKCGFRHPPLDGLLGGQAATVSGPPVPPSQKIRTPGIHASYGPKPVPCVFFQQGQCLKGDMCLFLHGPNPATSSKAPQVQGTKQCSDPPKLTKAFGSLKKCGQEKRIPQANVNTSLADGYVAKPVRKVGTTAKTNSSSDSIVPPPTSFTFDASRSKATSISPTANGISSGRYPFHASDDHNLQNGKDSEEFLRESSPGFDVLVDDDLRASDDYYHDEDHFGREDNLGSMAEFDGQSADYNSLNDMHGQGRFHDSQTYTSYDHLQEPYHQNITSSDRIKGGPDHLERRGYGKAGSPDNTLSDLRYRLSKQRRVEGLRSVVSRNVPLDDHYDERSFRSPSRKDLTRQPLSESSLSNRLRGRIKLAEGSQVSSYQGRLRDGKKGRGSMDDVDGKNLRIRQMRRDVNSGSSGFAGPKSLAELKAVKTTENKEQYLLRKRKFENDHISNDISFESPKPLSEILKEKRGAAAASGTFSSSNNNKNNNTYEIGETKTSGSNNRAAVGTQSSLPSLGKDDPSENASEGGDKSNLIHGLSSEEPLANEYEAEEGMINDEMLEGQENEGDEPMDEEYQYDHPVYGKDYGFDGDVHIDLEEEYLEEDGDDFAKKIGAVLS